MQIYVRQYLDATKFCSLIISVTDINPYCGYVKQRDTIQHLNFISERKCDMQAIKAVYDGFHFKPKQPIPIQGRYEVVITFIEPVIETVGEKATVKKRQLGFLKDKVPALPDSFFDPLPEEDLQAWGL